MMKDSVVKLGRAHFGLVAVYAVFILASDAWNLVTRDLTSQRWLMWGLLLTVTTVVWFFARYCENRQNWLRLLVILLVLTDIALATFAIWTERGMASRGVILYTIPIVSSAVLLSRPIMFATAALSTAAYVMTATRYFYVFFNEGYKVELYTALFLYSAVFFILAAILWIVLTGVAVNSRKSRR